MLKYSDQAILRTIRGMQMSDTPTTLKEIARRSLYTKRTVIRSVQRLETLGIIEVYREHKPNRYEVLEEVRYDRC